MILTDSSTASSPLEKTTMSLGEKPRWRGCLWAVLRYVLCFVVGVGVGVGIVCLVLRNMGILGNNGKSKFKSAEIHLGSLPVSGKIDYGFVDMQLHLSPLPAAGPYDPKEVQLLTRCLDEGEGEFAQIASVPYLGNAVTRVRVVSLKPGGEYEYKYRIKFADGRLSNESSIMRVRQLEPKQPTVPSLFRVHATTNALVIGWKPYSEEEALRLFGAPVTEYHVVMHGQNYRRVQTTSVNSHTITGLKSGETVNVELQATNAAGVSLVGAEMRFTTNEEEVDVAKAKNFQVAGFTATGIYEGGQFKWELPTREAMGGSDVLFHQVEVNVMGGQGPVKLLLAGGRSESLKVENLPTGKYSARVRAVSSLARMEEHAWSPSVDFETATACLPDALEAVNIKFKWKDAFSVYFSLPAQPKCRTPVSKVKVLLLPVAGPEEPAEVCVQEHVDQYPFCDFKVAENALGRQEYTMVVVAENGAGQGTRSKPLTAKLNSVAHGQCTSISDGRWMVHSHEYDPNYWMNWGLAKAARAQAGDGSKSLAAFQKILKTIVKDRQKHFPFLNADSPLSPGCASCFAETVKQGRACASECRAGDAIHAPACIECTKAHKEELRHCAGLAESHMPPKPTEKPATPKLSQDTASSVQT